MGEQYDCCSTQSVMVPQASSCWRGLWEPEPAAQHSLWSLEFCQGLLPSGYSLYLGLTLGFLLISSGVYAGINITEKWSEEPRCGQGAALISSLMLLCPCPVWSPFYSSHSVRSGKRGSELCQKCSMLVPGHNTIGWGVTYGNVTEECRHAFGM